MGLNWNQISMDEMTMLYLYGSFSYPTDLRSDSIIRPKDGGATVVLDSVAYMMTGPGRFAAGSLSPLIEEFMGDHGIATNQELLEGVSHELNAQGQRIFTKQDIAGYLVSKGYIPGSYGINIEQYNYKDEVANDIAIRTYIYGSTAFQIDDGAKFVIDADGTRHITDFAIVPRSDKQENFNFDSSDPKTNALEPSLINAIDPWEIGRTVKIQRE